MREEGRGRRMEEDGRGKRKKEGGELERMSEEEGEGLKRDIGKIGGKKKGIGGKREVEGRSKYREGISGRIQEERGGRGKGKEWKTRKEGI